MKRFLFCLLSACALHLTVSAHVLDQYLQVAQIALAPDGVRIELRLIPGAQVADRVCALIDADSDGRLSMAEEQAYARRVQQDLALEINGVRTTLSPDAIQFPSPPEMHKGLGTIRLTYTAAATLVAADNHQLYFRNDHLPELGVYLVNALVPATSEIKITGQERDVRQREMRLSFHTTSATTHAPQPWAGLFMLGLSLAILFLSRKFFWRAAMNRPSLNE